MFEGVPTTVGWFMTHGTDHHSHVIFPKAAMDRMGRGSAGGHVTNPEVTTNQITWQVGTLSEVGNGIDWFKSIGINPGRIGRDVPGSNWHSYPSDPEGHTNEIYYGIEQIGWNLKAKPPGVRKRGFHDKPDLPQISEYQEFEMFKEEGMDSEAGFRRTERLPFKYDVGGVMLARPFKIIKIGPVRLFVSDMEKCLAFYTQTLGLRVTEEVVYEGHRCVFLRCNTEHHSLALYPIALRAKLGLSPHTTCMSFGNQVGDYQQLRNAVDFLKANGVTIKHLPPSFFRHRLLRLRGRCRRPSDAALLLHGAARLGRQSPAKSERRKIDDAMARDRVADGRHLRRRNTARPARLTPRRFEGRGGGPGGRPRCFQRSILPPQPRP